MTPPVRRTSALALFASLVLGVTALRVPAGAQDPTDTTTTSSSETTETPLPTVTIPGESTTTTAPPDP